MEKSHKIILHLSSKRALKKEVIHHFHPRVTHNTGSGWKLMNEIQRRNAPFLLLFLLSSDDRLSSQKNNYYNNEDADE